MIDLLRREFVNRRVLVTGHTGFKGSWLCIWLHRLGASVAGYALPPPTSPANFFLSDVPSLMWRQFDADVRDAGELEAAVREVEPVVIFHLAAQSVVRYGYDHPDETFDVNVMGVVRVLEAIRAVGKPCVVVIVTSDKCYENQEQVWGYRECDPMGGSEPYSASKGAAELVVQAYRESYFPPERLAEHGVSVASVRAGNVIGGGDWTQDALVVDLLEALAEERPVMLRNPNAIRPWQHVLQALGGYLTLAARLLESDAAYLRGAWNFGPLPGDELSVRDFVELFFEEWGGGAWRDMSGGTDPPESQILRLAIDKSSWRLPWRPDWDVRETIRRTVEWYREFDRRPEGMRSVCENQIEAFQQSAG